MVNLYRIRKYYINLYNNKLKKIIFDNLRNRYREFLKEMLAICIKKFNKIYGTKFKGNEITIHIKDKKLENYGFKLFCGCNFIDLKDLALQNCKLNDISPLANAPFIKITNLSLGSNQIVSLEFITKINFPNLKNLLLGGNLINNLLPLENYSSEKLKVLFLLDNKIKNIEPLIKLNTPNLEELYLGNDINELTPLSKCNFKLLKQLSLNKNKIENISILEKCNFKNLEVLILSNNKIVDASPLIKCNFPKIKKISLRSNCIKEIKIFLKFKNLKQLDIAQNNFSPESSINKMVIEELNTKISSLITK